MALAAPVVPPCQFGKFMRLGERLLQRDGEGGWRERLHDRNREAADWQRLQRARRFHRDIAAERRGEEPASEDDVVRLATLCFERVEKVCRRRRIRTASEGGAPSAVAPTYH